MPLKKSALLVILLSASSVSLLVFSAAVAPVPVVPVIPLKCMPANSCSQITEPKTFPTWDMISQIMWRSAA